MDPEYSVYVISDCVTSYDLKKIDEMYAYYANKGCEVKELKDYMETKYDAPQGVSKSGICRESDCREED